VPQTARNLLGGSAFEAFLAFLLGLIQRFQTGANKKRQFHSCGETGVRLSCRGGNDNQKTSEAATDSQFIILPLGIQALLCCVEGHRIFKNGAVL
jgi:hypothetical protein